MTNLEKLKAIRMFLKLHGIKPVDGKVLEDNFGITRMYVKDSNGLWYFVLCRTVLKPNLHRYYKINILED